VSEFIEDSDDTILNRVYCEHGILLGQFCLSCNTKIANEIRAKDIDFHIYGGRIK
jgi:hypothetical protein